LSIRRFTRLTNGFSKKVENHGHATALHFMYYNFGRIHKTLRITPAMGAGISDHVWTLEEIAALMDANQVPQKRRAYKKRNSNRETLPLNRVAFVGKQASSQRDLSVNLELPWSMFYLPSRTSLYKNG
jgi:hypothetical protein